MPHGSGQCLMEWPHPFPRNADVSTLASEWRLAPMIKEKLDFDITRPIKIWVEQELAVLDVGFVWLILEMGANRLKQASYWKLLQVHTNFLDLCHNSSSQLVFPFCVFGLWFSLRLICSWCFAIRAAVLLLLPLLFPLLCGIISSCYYSDSSDVFFS